MQYAILALLAALAFVTRQWILNDRKWREAYNALAREHDDDAE